MVALLAKEADAASWSERLDGIDARFTSPVAVVETTMVLSSLMRAEVLDVERVVGAFIAEQGVRVVAITSETAALALGAFARYGKGRHPARLNLGDCFSYACAKEHGLTLLYKGDDFARTDVA